MTPQRLTIGPLFGEIAIDLGLVDSSQLLDALCAQEEQWKKVGEIPRIGQILVWRGILTPRDVDRVMAEVERRTWAIEVPGYHSLQHMASDETMLHFRAVEDATSAPVSIKFLRFRLADRKEASDRFRRENEALARLKHPNILRVLDSGDLEGIPYFVMEHVKAPSLRTVLAKNGALPERTALSLLRGMAAGLDHAHSFELPHGAVRPAAILITKLTGAKVADFSLADRGPSGPRSIRPGSPHYLSPEQARGNALATVSGDLYSLGAVLYHMLVGHPPYSGTYEEILEQHVHRAPPDPRSDVEALAEETAELVLSLLAKKPAARPRDMKEVLARITPVTAT